MKTILRITRKMKHNLKATTTCSFLPGIMIAFLLLLSSNTFAQNTSKFGIEIRPAVSFATSEPSGADLGTGIGFEGIAEYSFLPQLSVYAGWGWNRFDAPGIFSEQEATLEETGYTFGLRYIYQPENSVMGLFFRAGGIYNHLELENGNGEIASDTGHGFGWQAEAGLNIIAGKRWLLRPGVKYQSLTRDLEVGTISSSETLSYISVGLAFTYRF